ncbi:MAG: hypothetical protein ACJAZO_001673 [Myxococcota bacterium]|jgi:hypothetical protein
MGLWERLAGDMPMPDIRLAVATLVIALSAASYRAGAQFIGSDPVVQHDLAMLIGTAVSSDVFGQLNGLRDVEHAVQTDPSHWPAVEYRE